MTEQPSDDLRKCPFCAELIKVKAVFCKHCKSQVPAAVGSDSQLSTGDSSGNQSADFANLGNALSGLVDRREESCARVEAPPEPALSRNPLPWIVAAIAVPVAVGLFWFWMYGDYSPTKHSSSTQTERVTSNSTSQANGGNEAGTTTSATSGDKDVYTVTDDEMVWSTWKACDAMERNDERGIEAASATHQVCDHVLKGATVRVLERLGGDIAYVRVRVLSGSDTSDGAREGWIPEKSLTQSVLPTDELRARFNALATGLDGVSMSPPTFSDASSYGSHDRTKQNFYCQVSDGIGMSGKIDSDNKITSVDLDISGEYHGDSSVLTRRESCFAASIACLVRALDAAITADSAKALVRGLGVTPGAINFDNLKASNERTGFSYSIEAYGGSKPSATFTVKRTTSSLSSAQQSEPVSENSVSTQIGSATTTTTAGTTENQTSAPTATDEHAQSEQNREQSASQSTVGNDPTSLIDQMLHAQKGHDESSMTEVKSRLGAIPKPVPGDSIEATRLNKVGLTALRAKRYDEAVSDFAAAAKADASDPKLLSNLGFAEMYSGNLKSAQKHLCSSIALDPSKSVGWGDLGLVLARMGKQDEAVSAFVVGYKVSNGKTLGFLQSLNTDADPPSVREAARLALSSVQSTAPGPSARGQSLSTSPAPSTSPVQLTENDAKRSDQMTLVGVIDGAATFETPSGTITLHVGESYQNVRIKAIDKMVDGVSVMLEENTQLTTKTLRQKTTP